MSKTTQSQIAKVVSQSNVTTAKALPAVNQAKTIKVQNFDSVSGDFVEEILLQGF